MMLHLILLLCIFGYAKAETLCDESQECYDTNLDDTSTIICSGCEACEDARLDAPTYVECSGLRACENSILESTAEFRCWGAYGCDDSTANSGAIDQTGTESGFHCNGVRGCSSSLLYAPHLKASGHRALYLSNIYAETSTEYDKTYFYVYGGWGAKSASFYSNSVSDVAVYFEGTGSADSATFYCLGGSSCYIYCNKNACSGDYVNNDLTIYYDSDSSYTLVCDVDGSGCATETEMSSSEAKTILSKKDTKPTKLISEKSSTASSKLVKKYEIGQDMIEEEKKNEKKYEKKLTKTRKLLSTWTYCQESGDCSDDSYTNFVSLSCRGSDSCVGSTFSDWTGWISAWGYYAAKSAVISNGPDVQCHGYYACRGATISDTTTLWVSGFRGANEATITNVNQIITSTGSSLESATITANSEDLYIYSWGQNLEGATIDVYGRESHIYFYGYYSGTNARVNCRDGATCNVYCGYYACSNTVVWTSLDSTTTLTCSSSSSDYCATEEEEESMEPTSEPTMAPTDETVNCTTANQCTGTVDSDIINCFGANACRVVTLEASNQINCDGPGSTCSNSILTATNEINCLGSNTCETSRLTSDTVNCIGNFVCAGTQFIDSTTLNCDGVRACNGLRTDGYSITCDGEEACSYMQWEPDTDNSNMDCNGLDCFEKGTLRIDDNVGTVTINLDGNFAARDANFYSGDNNILYIYEGEATSPLSGARLYCQSGSTCYYYCSDTANCTGFLTYCDGDLYDQEIFDGTCERDPPTEKAKKLGKKIDTSKLINDKVTIRNGGIKHESQFNYLFLTIGVIIAVVFLGTFCYFNKDKLTNRWNYQQIPDQTNV